MWVPCKVFDAPKDYGVRLFPLKPSHLIYLFAVKPTFWIWKWWLLRKNKILLQGGPILRFQPLVCLGGIWFNHPDSATYRRMSWKIRFHRFSLDSMEIILGLNRFFSGGSHGGPFRVKSPWRIKILASFIAFNFKLCFFDSIDLKGKFKTLFF